MVPAPRSLPPTPHRSRPYPHRLILALILAVGAYSAAPTESHAQQSIVSMPSADITEEGRSLVMHETQARLWAQRSWSTTHFFTYGVGHHTELAVTLFDVGIPASGNSTLAIGYKTAFPLLADRLPHRELRLTTGTMLLASISGRGIGHWFYTHLSGRIPRLETRIAAGITHATEQLFGKRSLSFIASIEQPIPRVPGLALVAEWFSGAHDFGNLIVGATYSPNPTWAFVLGYKIPTKDRHFTWREQALIAEIGVFFPMGRRSKPSQHSH